MDPATFGSIGVTVALASLGSEVIKTLIMKWIFPPSKDSLSEKERSLIYGLRDSLKEVARVVGEIPTDSPTLDSEERKALMELYALHDNKDQDGIPLWWIPRSWHKTLEESLKVSTDIAYTQKDLSKVLDHVVSALEKLVDRRNNE